MERESNQLEYKEKVMDSFLKTVSAYANFQTGRIVFGISDSKEVVGIQNPEKAALSIENKINDALSPVPEYQIQINEENHTLTLIVQKGMFAPYFYQGQAYMRKDSASVPVDRAMLMELILADKNLSFDQLPAGNTELTFKTLEKALQEKIGLKQLGKDTLVTLDLFDPAYGYTKGGLLFSDQNSFPGVDIARFGSSLNEILNRKVLEKQSVLDIYYQACDFFDLFYSYENIQGFERNFHSRIPQTAFREALANAIVHRDWSIQNASIQISMMEDRIDITSPGRLPKNMDEELYFQEFYSIPRNPHIAYLFLRLGIIERFGTGIKRIMDSYTGEWIKPSFRITKNSITVSLPVIDSFDSLDDEWKKIYLYLKKNPYSSRADIESYCGFSRSKTTNLLNRMMSENIIGRTGNSRSTTYFILD